MGGAAHVAALQPRVVRDADAGQDGDLFAAQAADAAAAVRGQSRLLGRDPGAAGGEELADLFPRVHESQRRAGFQRLGDPASSALDRDSRTELLTKESTNFAEPSIEDYAERGAAQREFWTSQNGQQTGDPAKLAQALLTIAHHDQPPRRFIAGSDAITTAEQHIAKLQQETTAYHDLSSSLALDEATV